jgi:Uma2 family endonuclease
MATVTQPEIAQAFPRPLEPERRFVLRNVGWSGYEALLKMIGDGHTRVTYDRGDVELMAPSEAHDDYARLIGRLLDTVTEELRIPYKTLRSTTWRKRLNERGLEADDCFYLSSVARIIGTGRRIDLTVDPPPDLALEIEISRSALDRMGVYAGLGVPEVWRFDGQTLTIHRLQDDGSYTTIDRSVELPVIAPEEVAYWVKLADNDTDHTEWGRNLREWVRADVLPRWRENQGD